MVPFHMLLFVLRIAELYIHRSSQHTHVLFPYIVFFFSLIVGQRDDENAYITLPNHVPHLKALGFDSNLPALP